MQSPLPLSSRYQVLHTIASGGVASVHLARILGDGEPRTVAIKVLHPHLADDPEIVAMFVDEARIATRIHHPNVVAVSDVDMVGADLVIVMEFVEGVALHRIQRALHQQDEEMPLGFALAVMRDVLAGLHAAHELRDEQDQSVGLVHRDVSPQNILVGVDGIARVTDFGVATSTGRVALTRPDGPVKGKLQYLAPEQIRRGNLDRRVDVFAAGIVLWECLTGRSLFGGGTEAETLAMVLREPIPPPSTFRQGVSLELDEICLRALERDPARRFPSAIAFAEALHLVDPTPTARPLISALVERLGGEAIRRNRRALEMPSQASLPSPEDTGSKSAPLRSPSSSAAERSSSKKLMAIVVVALAVGTVFGGWLLSFATTKRAAAPVTTAPSSTVIAPSSSERLPIDKEPPTAITAAPPLLFDGGAPGTLDTTTSPGGGTNGASRKKRPKQEKRIFMPGQL